MDPGRIRRNFDQNEELDGVRYDDYIRIFDVMGYLDYAETCHLPLACQFR